MEPIIDHIQITVKDMAVAEPFYDEFFALLGFDVEVTAADVSGKRLYRVLVGPFDSKTDVQRAKTRLREQRIDPLLLERQTVAG